MWRDACGVVGLQGGDVEEKCGTGIVTQCEWGRRRWKGGKRGNKGGFDRGLTRFLFIYFGFGLDLCWASKGWVLFVGFIDKGLVWFKFKQQGPNL